MRDVPQDGNSPSLPGRYLAIRKLSASFICSETIPPSNNCTFLAGLKSKAASAGRGRNYMQRTKRRQRNNDTWKLVHSSWTQWMPAVTMWKTNISKVYTQYAIRAVFKHVAGGRVRRVCNISPSVKWHLVVVMAMVASRDLSLRSHLADQ